LAESQVYYRGRRPIY